MDTNKILSARWLDILFDNRNKEYGAYELRNTYPKRIAKALFITLMITATVFTGATLAGSVKKQRGPLTQNDGIIIAEFEEKKLPEPLPEPERIPEPQPPVRTQIFTPPAIVEDKDFDKPLSSQEDLLNAKIDVAIHDGPPFTGISDPVLPGDNKGIITDKKDKEPEIYTTVQVPSRFIGDWVKFLLKNLDPDVPVENDAPAGRYTVIVQFVVDKDGNVSDIKPLTNVGYGMEEEAVRVLKRATKWEPAINGGYPVKAYHRQPITFQVLGEE